MQIFYYYIVSDIPIKYEVAQLVDVLEHTNHFSADG